MLIISGGGNLAIGANIISQSGGITLSGANITRSAGNIASTGAVGANAGNINMSATGAITLGAATISANSVAAATAGNAGNINISAGTGFTGTGAINTTGGNSTGASTVGGSGGSVSIVSTTGAIGTGTITTSGGAAGAGIANGSNAGNVTVTASAGNATVGAITARTGSATGTGASGGVANVNVSGAAVTLAAVNTSGQNNGNGGTISANASGVLTLNGAITTAGGVAITGNAGKNAGLINLTGASINSAAAGTITASGSNGSGANQAGGNGAAVNINATGAISVRAITANGGNGVATNAKGGDAGSITISTNNGNISTNAGALNARTGVGIGTGANAIPGFIAISNTSATGTITTGSISTAGNTNGNGGNISVTGNGAVNIAGAVSSSGSASTGTRAGRNAGNITITGATVNAGAITASGGAGIGANQNGGLGGAVSLTAGTGNTITHTSITTSGGARTGTGIGGNGGNIGINGNSLLAADTSITSTVGTGGVSSGTVNFAGTINSSGANRALNINTTAATTLNGAIGNTSALTSLTTNAGGNTAINGGAVTTTGAQTYNDTVSTSGNTTFTTTNSNVTFANSIAAAGNTVISAGTGTVTATNAVNNFNNLSVTAGSANIRDASAIVLGATNVTGAYTLQSGGTVTQSASVSVGGNTSLIAGANDVTLNNPLNDFNTVTITNARDVNIVDANALTIGTSAVRILAARTLSNNLTLGGNVTATGAGNAIVLASAANFINTSNSILTPGTGRWLVYSNNPLLDTRGAGLHTAYDFKQYNTAFGSTILSAGDGFIYTLAPTITPTLGGTATKTYDGNTTAPIASLTIGQSGALDGDTVNLSALTSATYDNKNAGTGKTVTSNMLSITGADNAGKAVFGYQLATTTASGNVGTINQATLNLNAVSDTKQYDGNTNSVGIVSTGGLVLGDTITGLSQSFVSKNVLGNNSSTLNVNADFTINDGNGGNNYSLISNSASGTITPLTITGSITANNKTYDGNNVATIATRNLAGVIGMDDVTYTGGSATFNNKNAGTGKTVTATGLGLTGFDAGNYTVNDTALTTADIARADISAVTGITANSKVYDATTGAILNTSAAGFVGLIGSDDLNVAAANANFIDANAGVGKTVNITGISLGGTDAGNYNLVTNTATTAADITQRAITVTANPGQSKVFGAADPLPFTFTVAGLGLVGGDTLIGALNRTVGETVGNYAINQGSLLASSNYILSYVGNNFNILAPSTVGGGSGDPRNAAGLVDLNPSLSNYTNPQLFVLNVVATAAGVDSEGQAGCEQDPESLAKDQDFVLMLNYGLNLPKGLNTSCDKAKI
jgi:trimeric autotransporter adhesin